MKALLKNVSLIFTAAFVLLFVSCTAAAGGPFEDVNNNGRTAVKGIEGVKGLADSLWIFNKANSIKQPGVSAGVDTGATVTDNTTEKNPILNGIKNYDYKYIYFYDDELVFFGNVSWNETLEEGEVVSASDKKYEPEYAGKYFGDSTRKAVSFNFNYENVKNNVWLSLPDTKEICSFGENLFFVSHTEDNLYFTYKVPEVNKADSRGPCSNSSTYEESPAHEPLSWTWNKDSFDLNKNELTMNYVSGKFTDSRLNTSIFISPTKDPFVVDYIAFENYTVASSGSLRNSNGIYSVISANKINVPYSEYNRTIYNADRPYNELYTVRGAGDFTTIENITTGKVYKKLDSSKKIYATASELEEIGKDFSNIVSIYPDVYDTGSIYSINYDNTKEWCYQNANFKGAVNGQNAAYMELKKETDSNGVVSYYYEFEDFLNGRKYKIEKLLPYSFVYKEIDSTGHAFAADPFSAPASSSAQNIHYGEVTPVATSTTAADITATAPSAGSDIVNVKIGSTVYTLSFDSKYYGNLTINSDAKSKIFSMYIIPLGSSTMNKPVFADIDNDAKTITFDVPDGFDKTNAVLNYIYAEPVYENVGNNGSASGSSAASNNASAISNKDTCFLAYANSKDAPKYNYYVFNDKFRKLSVYPKLYKKENCIYWYTPSAESLDELDTIVTYYNTDYKKSYLDCLYYRYDSDEFFGKISEKDFLTGYEESEDGRVKSVTSDVKYMAAPSVNKAADYFLTWEAYEFFKEVYLAQKGLGPDGKTPLEKDFNLADYDSRYPSKIYWAMPYKKPSYQNTGAQDKDSIKYRPVSKKAKLGKDFTSIKSLLFACTLNDVIYESKYEVIFK